MLKQFLRCHKDKGKAAGFLVIVTVCHKCFCVIYQIQPNILHS